MADVTIEKMSYSELPEVAEVVSRAINPTPIALAIIKVNNTKNLKKIIKGWIKIIEISGGDVYTAKNSEGKILGVIRIIKWPNCDLTYGQMIKLLLNFLIIMPLITTRYLKLMWIWSKHDPKKPHLHIDPLGVLPDYQNQGLGTKLMTHLCKLADEKGLPGYLETDQQRTVKFYNRFGFKCIGEKVVFGVPTYFLWREAKK